jgi:hypothetical protein
LFEIAFEESKSVFNTQKVRLKGKKKIHLVKKLKVLLTIKKALNGQNTLLTKV